MTIICIKDGVAAADGASWQGQVMTRANARKIARSLDGALGGAAGRTTDTAAWLRWFATTKSADERQRQREKGGAPEIVDKTEFGAMWLECDCGVWGLDDSGAPYAIGRGPQSIGVVSTFALGAMHAGASAEEAVRLCIANCVYTGGEVFVERVGPKE